MNTTAKDFYHIYEAQAGQFAPQEEKTSLLMILLQASGIFITITVIVFFIANYQYIKVQLADWKSQKNGTTSLGENFIEDKDMDGVPDWWELKNNLNPKNPRDAFGDPDNDLAINLEEFQYNIDPNNPDSDRDGFFDEEEIKAGFNPNGVGKIDTDKDGMPDWWEEKFGLNKFEPSDAQQDNDFDGLTNLDELSYQTNPTLPDTDSDGIPDGEEITKGQNPCGEGKLPQKGDGFSKDDPDGDGLGAFYEDLFGTDPKNDDTDGDGFGDLQEISKGYDPTGPGLIVGEIEVPNISVDAPIVWSQSDDEKLINNDLGNGVIHYPGTAFPGMNGNSYLTGHSSYYSWSKSPYKEVLKNLGNLKEGDKILIYLTLQNGKKINLTYQVKSSEVVMPDDGQLFRDFEGKEMTLVTCWPVGTDWKRLMIKANLISPLP